MFVVVPMRFFPSPRYFGSTGHPVHRLAPDGNGGYKATFICGMSTKHYCIGFLFASVV